MHTDAVHPDNFPAPNLAELTGTAWRQPVRRKGSGMLFSGAIRHSSGRLLRTDVALQNHSVKSEGNTYESAQSPNDWPRDETGGHQGLWT